MWRIAAFLIISTVGLSSAEFNATLSRKTFFNLALSALADYTEVCLVNLLPEYELDEVLVVPCDMKDAPINPPPGSSAITCKAITAVNHREGIIAVVFRGTSSNAQLKEENITTTHTYLGTHVQQYFYFGFSQLYFGKLELSLIELLRKNPFYRLYVTGHSLGAAMASLLATTLLNNNPSLNLTLITYGEPRVGLQDYANLFDSLVKDPYRVTHKLDPVPHLAPKYDNYSHGHSEIWFNNTMSQSSTYTQCNADDIATFTNVNCSNTIENVTIDNIQITYLDHLTYYNILMLNFVNDNCTDDSESTPAPTTSNPNPTCPSEWIHSTVNPDTCYKYMSDSTNFFAAHETCMGYGGNLISIDNAYSNSELTNNITSVCTEFYIGLVNNGTSSTSWVWVNGDTSTYRNWENNYPVNISDACVIMAKNDGRWENRDCTRFYCYICEKPFK